MSQDRRNPKGSNNQQPNQSQPQQPGNPAAYVLPRGTANPYASRGSNNVHTLTVEEKSQTSATSTTQTSSSTATNAPTKPKTKVHLKGGTLGAGAKLKGGASKGGTLTLERTHIRKKAKAFLVSVGAEDEMVIEDYEIEAEADLSLFAGEEARQILEEMEQKAEAKTPQIQAFQQKIEALEEQIQELTAELDMDEESQREMAIINSDPELRSYYDTLSGIEDFFLVARVINTGQVNQTNNATGVTINVLTQIGAQIPVVGALAKLIGAGAQAANTVSQRRSMSTLTQWTHGLADAGQLARRFARKMTLARRDQILNPAPESKQEPTAQPQGLVQKVQSGFKAAKQAGKNAVEAAQRKKRELYSGEPSTPTEELALKDMNRVLEAIMDQEITPNAQNGNRLEQMFTAAIPGATFTQTDAASNLSTTSTTTSTTSTTLSAPRGPDAMFSAGPQTAPEVPAKKKKAQNQPAPALQSP